MCSIIHPEVCIYYITYARHAIQTVKDSSYKNQVNEKMKSPKRFPG